VTTKKKAKGVSQVKVPKKLNRALKVEIEVTPEQLIALRETQRMYAEIFERAGEDMVAHKSTDTNECQKRLYAYFVTAYPTLPTQLIIRAISHSASMIKSWNSNVPGLNKKRAQKNKNRIKRYGPAARILPMLKRWDHIPKMKPDSAMNYDLRLSTLRGEQLTISRAGGRRIQNIITVPEWWKNRISHVWKYKALTLKIHDNGKVVAGLIFVADPPQRKETGKGVGLDRGVNAVIATSEGEIFSGKERKAHHRRFLFNRRGLQSIGTRSARRLLRKLSGREQRYGQNQDHIISKKLAEDPNVAYYVVEDLMSLAMRALKGNRKSNKTLSDWSHARLLAFLAYKCQRKGIYVFCVNPQYTSQRCSECKYVDEKNRNKSRFKCLKCDFTCNADINAAINILDVYLSGEIISSAGHSQRSENSREGKLHARKSSVDDPTKRRSVGNRHVGFGSKETTDFDLWSESQAPGLVPGVSSNS